LLNGARSLPLLERASAVTAEVFCDLVEQVQRVSL